jgi:hypothetical protein
MNALTRLRKICLSLPESHEKVAWSAPTFRVKGKQFAMFLANHHGDGRVAVWCKAAPGVQEALIEADPEQFFRPPYVGPSGWIGIRLDRGIDWHVVSGLLKDGWREAAPQKLVSALDASPSSSGARGSARGARTTGKKGSGSRSGGTGSRSAAR